MCNNNNRIRLLLPAAVGCIQYFRCDDSKAHSEIVSDRVSPRPCWGASSAQYYDDEIYTDQNTLSSRTCSCETVCNNNISAPMWVKQKRIQPAYILSSVYVLRHEYNITNRIICFRYLHRRHEILSGHGGVRQCL